MANAKKTTEEIIADLEFNNMCLIQEKLELFQENKELKRQVEVVDYELQYTFDVLKKMGVKDAFDMYKIEHQENYHETNARIERNEVNVTPDETHVTLEKVLGNCWNVYDLDMFLEQASDVIDRDCYEEPLNTIFLDLEDAKEIIERMTLISKFYQLLDLIGWKSMTPPMFANIKTKEGYYKMYLMTDEEIYDKETNDGRLNKFIVDNKVELCKTYGFNYASKLDDVYMFGLEFLDILLETFKQDVLEDE